MLGKPASDLGVLVSAVVVGDHMDLEVHRHAGIDVAQELQELLMTMSWLVITPVPRSTGDWSARRLRGR